MILKALLVPSLLLIAGLVLLALAILAPARADTVERIRALEALVAGGGDAVGALRAALEGPEPEVAAVAAIHLRRLARDDLIRTCARAGELARFLPPP